MARKGMQPTSYSNVLSFSKHQIWCPSSLGWDRVNCLAKIGGRAKAWSAISYTLLISTFSLHGKKEDAASSIFWMCIHFQYIIFGVQASLAKKGMQPTAFLNVLSFSKTSNLVEKGFIVWKKMGAGLKHAQQFRTFILLRPVVTFSIYHHFILFLASGDL